MPPSTSGIAAYSAEVLPLLRARHDIDVFLEAAPVPPVPQSFSGHDFVWKHRRAPYDLVVYQHGNAHCHDYMWAYLFHYPGLVVLHDAQLHQARALFLTRRHPPARARYLAEFAASHPDAPPALGRLFADGRGDGFYPHWPLLRLVLERARLTAVHNRRLMRLLSERYPQAAIEAIEMGVADPVGTEVDGGTEVGVRARHGIPADAVVIAAFGGVTPEKRIEPLLRALSTLEGRTPPVHLLLLGATATHYDVEADIARWRVGERVHLAGFVPDEELPAYLAAADIAACLRWPSNRETSASWLRCLGASLPTLVTDLVHLVDVPTLDPRGWRVRDAAADGPREPVAVAIDILDEPHSLQLALDRLVREPGLRRQVGAAGRRWWEARHQLAQMAEAYERLFARAAVLEPPVRTWPDALGGAGTSRLEEIAGRLGVTSPLPAEG